MRLSKQYEVGLSFWEANPQLTKMAPFSKLYGPDRTKGKERSSNKAWGIVLFCENEEYSTYARFDDDEKEKRIGEDFGVDFRGKLVKECIEHYKEHHMSFVEKQLSDYRRFLERRTQWIMSKDYDDPTVDIDRVEKSAANTRKLWDEYEKILDKFKEENAAYVEGGRVMSASEQLVI